MPTKDTTSDRAAPARQRLTVSRIEKLTIPPGKTEVTLWDTETPRLGVRLQRGGRRSFIYSQRINGRQARITIGPVADLTLEQARSEAKRISGLIAQGIDPREEKRQRLEAAEAALRERERAKITFGELWDAYIEANADGWGERHLKDHAEVMKQPGQQRRQSKKKTVAGVLWPLHDVLLGDLTPPMLQAHMAKEAARRPTTAAKAFRLLRACLRWGRLQPEYDGLYDAEKLVAAAGKKVPKASKPKDDVLQREQLAAWFQAVQDIKEPAHRAYLQALLLTGARPGELRELRWSDMDLQWNTLTIRDKVEGVRVIPLTPYVRQLLQALPHRGEYVFTTHRTKAGGHASRANRQHTKALQAAGLPHVTLHGLRRSFGSLTEWVEVPAGIVAQIMGHKPKATAERHYRVRPVELLRQWHTKIEAWMLDQAGIEQPAEDAQRLEVVR